MADVLAIAHALREQFPAAVTELLEFRGELTLVVQPEHLLEVATAARRSPGLAFDVFSDLCAVDHLPREPRFDLNYQLYSTAHGVRLRLKVRVPQPAAQVCSLTSLWPGANWYEREVYDLFGITFAHHPDLRRLLLPEDFVGHPLRRDFHGTDIEEVQFTHNFDEVDRRKPYAAGRPPDEPDRPAPPELTFEQLKTLVSERALAGETMLLNMGPQHPSTHGVLRLLLELDGESVLSCVPDVGYLHTGIEKTAERQTYVKVIPLTDRMDYLAPLSNNLGYCLAVEKLMGVEAPPRAQYVRVILCELTRLASHLVWLGTHALDVGAMSMFLYCFREREAILDLFEMVSGQRMMASYFRPGGLWRDIPADFVLAVNHFLRMMPQRLKEYETLLTANPLWLDRTRGVGLLDARTAMAYGVTGPSLRASGVNLDLRKAQPYSAYEQFEFNVPLGQNGDVYDRYRCRMQEMWESLHIIRQALNGLPDGPCVVDDRKLVPPPKEELAVSMEALIHHFKLWTQGFCPPPGEVYAAIESPRGEFGVHLCSDGSGKPRRVHFRCPSFANLSVLPRIARGAMVADLVAIVGSLDIVLGDVDR